MAARTEITRADVLPMAEYASVRKTKRRELVEIKKRRRVEIGPVATAYFESFDTMWWQIHEMLYIERGGEDQIEGELSAYNPLIPKGNELVCTVMFEIEDPVRRKVLLGRLGGVEETMFLEVGGRTIKGVPEADADRTDEDGKASSVQFVHFPFPSDAIAAFRIPGARVALGFTHPEYGHIAVMPEAVRAALAEDFA
ncbi:MAG: DUF3501 family protein [Alphaproteobacteria bacterium]